MNRKAPIALANVDQLKIPAIGFVFYHKSVVEDVKQFVPVGLFFRFGNVPR